MSTSRRARGDGSLDRRRNSDGSESWTARFYVNGRRVRRTLGLVRPRGTSRGLTEAMARRELRRLLDSDRVSLARSERVPFMEAAEATLTHLEALRDLKASSLRGYKSVIRARLAPVFDRQTVDKITPRAVEAWITSMVTTEGLSRQTARNSAHLLGTILSYSQTRGWCESNAAEGATRLLRKSTRDKQRAARIRFLTDEELAALIRAFPPDGYGPTDAMWVTIAGALGLRAAEWRELRWGDIRWESEEVWITRTHVAGKVDTPKSAAGVREIPASKELLAALARWQRASRWQGDDDLIVPHPDSGRHLDYSAAGKRYKRALGSAGLRDGSPHDLRHSAASRWASEGKPLVALQAWLGHSSLSAVAIYSRWVRSAARKADRGPVHGPNPTESPETSQHLG